MNDNPCKRIIQLEAERIELLAQLAEARERIRRLEQAIHDVSIALAQLPSTAKAQDMIKRLFVALEEPDDP